MDTMSHDENIKISNENSNTPIIEKENSDDFLENKNTDDKIENLTKNNLRKTKKTKQNKNFLKLYNVLKILSLVLGIIFAVYMLKQQDSKKNIMPYAEMQTSGRTKFVFEPADNYCDVDYFTKEVLLDSLVQRLQNIVNIYKYGTYKDKLNRISATQRNFFLYGPPGTGKTHFVKKLAFVLNLNLKLHEISKLVGKKKFFDLKNNVGDLFQMINAHKSKVRVIFITPSMINNKYIGESEAQVKELFLLANKKTEYDATLIFFDEMDSFFADRDARGQENYVNVKTEFLNRVTSIIEKDDGLVICIGATNRGDKLDGAFRRRFGEGYSFDLPTDEEIFELLKKSVKPWAKIDNFDFYLNKIKNITKGSQISQSNIIDIVKKTNFEKDCSDPSIYENLVINFQDFVSRNRLGTSYSPILSKNSTSNIYYNLPEQQKDEKYFSIL